MHVLPSVHKHSFFVEFECVCRTQMAGSDADAVWVNGTLIGWIQILLTGLGGQSGYDVSAITRGVR